MMRLHLIADDLTGALDTAAQFIGATGPIPVHWRGLPRSATVSSIAIDSGTREAGREEARETVAALAAGLPPSPEAISYAKLDSLLRGHAGAEIAGWIAALKPDYCIVAPAFPFQGRITRDGRQLFRTADGWQPTSNDLRADLEREGLAVRSCRPGDPVPPGVSLWDAETDADLTAIAEAGRALDGSVLWCGSSGLAGALAQTAGRPSGHGGDAILARPVLGLFGTNHPVMTAQLAACGCARHGPAGRWRRERRSAVPAPRRAGHRVGRAVTAGRVVQRRGRPSHRPRVGDARPPARSARHPARRRRRNAAGALSGAGG